MTKVFKQKNIQFKITECVNSFKKEFSSVFLKMDAVVVPISTKLKIELFVSSSDSFEIRNKIREEAASKFFSSSN